MKIYPQSTVIVDSLNELTLDETRQMEVIVTRDGWIAKNRYGVVDAVPQDPHSECKNHQFDILNGRN